MPTYQFLNCKIALCYAILCSHATGFGGNGGMYWVIKTGFKAEQ